VTEELDLICTFHVGELFLGVDVRHVQEVLRYQEISPVPWAPAIVSGLINLRGQIVTAIDLRRRFELGPRPESIIAMGIIVRAHEQAFSLLVDAVGDLVAARPELLERTPESLGGAAREVLRGVYKTDERLLLLLDLEKTIAAPAAAEGPALGN
jgi:purine-binding chemotaxis protein CheW